MSKMFTAEEKRIIGIICCFKIDEMEYQNNPTKILGDFFDERGNKLCSRRTWNRMASGISISKHGVYEQVIKKYGKPFIYLPNLEAELNICLQDLLGIIEEGKDEELIHCCQMTIAKLEPYQDSIYYGVYYQVVVDIMHCYGIGQMINQEHYYYYQKAYKCLPLELQILIKDMLFQFAVFVMSDIIMIQKLIEKFDYQLEDSIVLNIRYAQYLMFHNQSYDAYNLLSDLKKKCIKRGNYVQQIEINKLMLNIAQIINQVDVGKYEEEILAIIQQHSTKISAKRLGGIYYMYALRKYTIKDFEKTLDFIKKAITSGYTLRERECNTLLAFLSKRLGHDDPFLLFDDQLQYDDQSVTTIAYQYYVLNKNCNDPKILEKFIVENILRRAKDMDELYLDIFKYEIMLQNNETRRHSMLKRFLEKSGAI